MPSDRLEAIHDELAAILEERVTALTAAIVGVQEVTRQIASTENAIHRNEAVRDRLNADLAGLRSTEQGLEAENRANRKKVASLKENIGRLREMRQEMRSKLSSLTGELGSE